MKYKYTNALKSKRPTVSRFLFIAATSVYILLFLNRTFWGKLLDYSDHNLLFMVGVGVALTAALTAIFSLVAYRGLLKTIAIAFILIAAGSSYFVDSFGVLIDRSMVMSALETTPREAGDLMTFGILWHNLAFGILPVILILMTRIKWPTFGRTAWQNLAVSAACLAVVAGLVLTQFSSYASIIRNHRDLAKSLHPSQPINAFLQVGKQFIGDTNRPLVQIGLDARKANAAGVVVKPRLVVMVLGETARARSFSLNGYGRETNPELKKRDIINFTRVSSCGTATETSVPCMFSNMNRVDYSPDRARHTENVVDLIARAGTDVIWFNNNTGSKRVADRVNYVDVAERKVPGLCGDDGCQDEILLKSLDEQFKKLDAKPADTFIVLHTLGSHGPAYYKRVPDRFKRFEPICATNELNTCSQDQIVNAYDNTILYTDFIVASVIDMLEAQSDRFDTAMLYVSDHGESTGENGLYLHGMPYMFAPDEQTHVPMVAWFSKGFEKNEALDRDCLVKDAAKPVSHDNMFDTLLGLNGVASTEYRRELDLFSGCEKQALVSGN